MLLTHPGHGADVKCCDWHPRKSLLVSGSKDNQQPVKLWDCRSGQSISTMSVRSSVAVSLVCVIHCQSLHTTLTHMLYSVLFCTAVVLLFIPLPISLSLQKLWFMIHEFSERSMLHLVLQMFCKMRTVDSKIAINL